MSLSRGNTHVQSRIMYVEYKAGIACAYEGEAWISRVRFSKEGKTIYFRDKALQFLKGRAFLANYFDVDTGEEYWVSGCRREGHDALYAAKVAIDEDVREEYWRGQPERAAEASFRSEGKHTKSARRAQGKTGAEIPRRL
jgi:hypothetical protein